MRTLLLMAALVTPPLLAGAEEPLFTPGTWRLEKAYCTNPSYVPLPEEDAFNEALATGFITDRYLFTGEEGGSYETTWTADAQTRCVGTAPVTVQYLSGSRAKRSHGQLAWKHTHPDPNVTIQCDGGEEPFSETTRYAVTAERLIFSQDAAPQCGEHRMQWRRE
jgi:hypothetical protein